MSQGPAGKPQIVTDVGSRQALNVTGPEQGNVRVLAMTTSASAAQTVNEFAGTFVTLISPVAFYITIGPAGGVTDPDESQTSGAARTGEWPAYLPLRWKVIEAISDGFKCKGSANANIRWWPSSSQS